MKKLIILSLFMLALITSMFAQGAEPRTVYQEIALATVPTWTMTDYPTTDPHYLFHATYAGITFGTDSSMPEVSYFNVSNMLDFGGILIAQFDQAAWPVANTWVAGQTITMDIWYRDNTAVPFDTGTNPTAQYIMTVPAGFDPIINVPSLGIGTEIWTVPSSGGGPADTWTYNLTVNGPVGKTVTGPGTYAGATGDTFTCLTEINDLLGNWTISAADAGWQWDVNPITVVAGDFTGSKVDHVFNATITFVQQEIIIPDTWTYNLTVNGPAGKTITGPGTYAGATGDIFTCNTEINDLLGAWTISAADAGFHWVVNPITVIAGDFTGSKSQRNLKAIQGSRTNGAKVNHVYNATITFVQDPDVPVYWDVNVSSTPVGACIYIDGVVDPDGNVTPWTYSMLEGSSATYSVMMDGWTFDPLEYVVTNIMTIENAVFTGTEDTYDFPEGDIVQIPGAPAGNTIQFTDGNANLLTGPYTPTDSPNPLFIFGYGSPMTLVGPGPWTFTLTTTYAWVWIPGHGLWAGPGSIIITINPTKDEDIEIIYGGGGDPTLPVELSYFAATLTAQNFVNLTWVSQSETALLGYRVYRNVANNQAGAIGITPVMIPATNTSTTQTYSIIDNEVNIGSTYYYWLEAVDMNHSTFHGPVSVLVQGEVPPVLPEYTTMRNAYPNPFRANSNTTIEVSVKAGEAGSVTIYNILGQVVKTYSVKEGLNPLNWNGKDSKGNACGSGIYFYKLSTPSINQTKKMVIVK